MLMVGRKHLPSHQEAFLNVFIYDLCGGLIENGLQRLIGGGTVRRRGLVGGSVSQGGGL